MLDEAPHLASSRLCKKMNRKMTFKTKILSTAFLSILLAGSLSVRAQSPAPPLAAASTNLAAAAASVAAASTNLAAALAKPGNASSNIASATKNLAAALAILANISTNLATASTNPAAASASMATASTNLAAASTNLAAASAKLATASTSLAPGPAKPPPINPTNLWHANIAVGLTLARGNTDTTLFSVGAHAQKRWPGNDLSLGLDGLYGESKLSGDSKSTETAESLHGSAQDNLSFTDRLFGYARVDGLHDGIAHIEYRFTLAPGVGYYFIKNKVTDLSLEAGPGYIFEKLDDESQSFATLRIAEKFHYAISARARLWETLEFLPQVDNFNNYIANAELGVEASLNKSDRLTLRTVLQDSYDSIPAPGRLKNDLKLIASVAYKF
jgi:putative salt-induced outer membrane protein